MWFTRLPLDAHPATQFTVLWHWQSLSFLNTQSGTQGEGQSFSDCCPDPWKDPGTGSRECLGTSQ